MRATFVIPGVALLFLGLVIYGQTVFFGFVFDDNTFVVQNPFLKDFSGYARLWDFFPMTRLIGLASFTLNYQVSLLNPAGYHMFNLMVHFGATALVWALTRLLLSLTSHPREHQYLAWIVAVFFLVHPGQTQAVTYITQRFESMATVFYLAAVFSYFKARMTADRLIQIRWFLLFALMAGSGLFTKETILTLPLALLAAEWIFFPARRVIKGIVLCMAVSIVLIFGLAQLTQTNWSIFSQPIVSESHDGDILTPLTYAWTQMRVFLTFLRILLVPVHQMVDYDFPASAGLWHPPLTAAGLMAMMGMLLLAMKLRARSPLISFGLAWTIITFLGNMVPRANVIFEHKLYLISYGFCLVLTFAAAHMVKDRQLLIRGLLCLAALWTALSFERNKVWANEVALWEDNIKKAPGKVRVHLNLAREYGALGRHDDAVRLFSRIIELNPRHHVAYQNRAVNHFNQGQMALAMADFNASIALNPRSFSAYVKRAMVHDAQGDFLAALSDLAAAETLEPDFAETHMHKGRIYMRQGQMEKAYKAFEKAKSLDPALPVSFARPQ